MTLTEKDREAIAHIVKMSRHPHAKMIAEWLITGYKVEFLNVHKKDWLEITNPSWEHATQYRFINLKPAYRVFKYKNGEETCTQDRYVTGEVSYIEDVEWFSNWVEYDLSNTSGESK